MPNKPIPQAYLEDDDDDQAEDDEPAEQTQAQRAQSARTSSATSSLSLSLTKSKSRSQSSQSSQSSNSSTSSTSSSSQSQSQSQLPRATDDELRVAAKKVHGFVRHVDKQMRKRQRQNRQRDSSSSSESSSDDSSHDVPPSQRSQRSQRPSPSTAEPLPVPVPVQGKKPKAKAQPTQQPAQSQKESNMSQFQALERDVLSSSSENDDEEDVPQHEDQDNVGLTAAIEALSNLSIAKSQTLSRKIPCPFQLNIFPQGSLSNAVTAWAHATLSKDTFCLLPGPSSRVSLLLQAYAQVLRNTQNLSVAFCHSLFTPPDACFPFLEQGASLCGVFDVPEPLPAFSDEDVILALTKRFQEMKCDILIVTNCNSRANLSFLSLLWNALSQAQLLKQLVVGCSSQVAEAAAGDMANTFEELSIPTFFNPRWTHAAKSLETCAMENVVRCAVGCDHRVCAFGLRKLETAFGSGSQSPSIWAYPATLSRKRVSAIQAGPDQLLLRHLFLYRQTGDFLTLLTCVAPSREAAVRMNNFFSRNVVDKRRFDVTVKKISGAPIAYDSAPMDIELEDKDDEDERPRERAASLVERELSRLSASGGEFYTGQRVVLLSKYQRQEAGAFGVVCGLEADAVKVWFDKDQLIVSVGWVRLRVRSGLSSFRVQMIPLDTAFAITAGFFTWGLIGEVISCGLQPQQRKDVASSLMSATHFLWTDEADPIEPDAELFAAFK